MRILITGAAGFIGSHLSARLIAEGHEVIGVDNLRTGNWERTSEAMTQVEKDLCDFEIEAMEDLLRNVDILFHLAAVKHNTERNDVDDLLKNNILATNRLFEAAGLAGVKKVIFTSSLYTYGYYGPETMSEDMIPLPDTEYGISKLAGELLLKEKSKKYGFSYSALRLFFIYGPKQYAGSGYKSVIVKNFEQASARRPLTIYGNGQQQLDYVYVEDCISALCLAMRVEHESPLNIATGHGISINEVVSNISKLVPGTTTEYQTADWTEGTIRIGQPHKAHTSIGWKSKFTFEEGIVKIVDWMKGNES